MEIALDDKTTSPLAFIAIQAALKAGSLLYKGFGTTFKIETKSHAQDLVTEFDQAAEALIIDYIASRFPDHHFLAEESAHRQKCSQHPPKDRGEASPHCVRWIIDPLDGTMNFAHGLPLFAVSIAAVVDNVVEVGVIYVPMTQELFMAQRGYGAYLNGMPLQVSKGDNLSLATSSTAIPHANDRAQALHIKRLESLFKIGCSVRILGSAAISLAYVAAGRFDFFWAYRLQPWDVAAGQLLVEEAGGSILRFDGAKHDLNDPHNILAATPSLVEAVKAELA